MARRSEDLDLMTASPGTSRRLAVHRYGDAGARPKAYLQASLHADELPGGLVLHHLMARLDDADVAGEIVIVPAANPIGFGQQILGEHVGRYEATTGVNFNRSYPDLGTHVLERLAGRLGPDAATNVALIRAAMVEVLDDLTPTREIDQLKLALVRLAIDADIVLDLHCDLEAELHLFLSPELWPAGRDLAAELGAVATLLALDSGGGSFDEVFSLPWHKVRARFGGADVPVPPACLSGTVELRGQADIDDRTATADAAALFRFLQRRGLIAGDAGPEPALAHDATPLTACDVIRSPAAGILVFKQTLGAEVVAGDLVAEVLDPMAPPGTPRTEIRTQTTGRLFSRARTRLARPGGSVAKVRGTEPLPDRTGYLLED